jgi:hypothetical protein
VSIRIPPNDAFLAWVTAQSDPPVKRVWARRRVAPDSLRCHPDLCDRLEASATGLSTVRLRYLAGFPALVRANGVVFGVAAGTTWLALRIPELGQRAVLRSQWGTRGLDAEWVDVDPWISALPAHEGTSRLRGWTRAAHARAGELWGVPARTTDPARARGPAPRA